MAEQYSVSASPNPVNETAGSVTFTITRSGSSLPAEVVYVSTLNGSTPFAQYSTNSGDYTGLDDSAVSFGAGVTSESVTVQLGSSDTSGADKTFGFEVQAAGTTSGFTPDLAETSFTVDENAAASQPQFSVSASPNPVNETAGSVTFTITRSGSSLPAEVVYVSTLNGSTPFAQYSTNSGDYTGLDDSAVSFGAGVTSESVTVQLGSSDTSGADKTFGFEVQAAGTTSGFTPDLAETSFTVDENAAASQPQFSVSASPNPVNETAGSVTFTITRSGSSLPAEVVYVSTLNGSTPFAQYSTNSGDYTGLDDSAVSFGVGVTSESVTVQLGSSDTSGADKTFGFEVQAAGTTSGFTPDLAETSFTVDENAAASQPQFSVSASPNPVNETAGSVTFTITRSGSSLPAEVVYVSTLNGSTPFAQYSTNSGDYTGLDDSAVSFGAGVTSESVTVQLGSSDTSGADKTFGFEVQAAGTTSGFTPDLAETSFTVDENAAASQPQFSVSASPNPVNETAGSVTFTITRSGSSLPAEVVYVSTLNGSTPFAQYSTNSGDYTGLDDSAVSFGAGVTSESVTVQLGSSDTSGADKTFGFEVQAAGTTSGFTPDLAETSFTVDENDVVQNTPSVSHGVDYGDVGNTSATAGMDLAAIAAYDGFGQYAYTGGTQFVASYIGVHDTGYLTANPDVNALVGNHLAIVSLFERTPSSVSYFTGSTDGESNADYDAADAIQAAKQAGQPTGVGAIYFTVDYNPALADIPAIDAYFREIRADFAADGNPYKIGVYAPGSVLTALANDPLAKPDYTWLPLSAWGAEGFTGETISQVYTSSGVIIGTSVKAVDLDTAFAQNYGQWGIVPPTSSMPVISGALAYQTVADNETNMPFSAAAIADPNTGQTETLTVTISNTANGTLSDPNSASDGGAVNGGVYTVVGSAAAVTSALDGLVFTPSSASLLPAQTVTTTFTIQDTDTAGESATDSTTRVVTTVPPTTVNNSGGTSYLYTYNPTSTATETIAAFSGANNTGAKISDIVDNTDGTSLIYAYDPTDTVALTAQQWSSTDTSNGAPAGSEISDVVDDISGTCLVYAYDPTSTVTQTTQEWSATNAANGAPSGNEISDVVDDTNGTSLLYSYDPTSTVTQTTSEYSATNAANGAPTGNEISDVVDNTDGTSILYAYNPSSTVSETASFYSATGTAGAPAGTLTSETVDYTAGGSAITTYNPDDSSSTTYYSGPNGTGSVIKDPPGGFSPTLPDPPAGDVLAGGPGSGTSVPGTSPQDPDVGTDPAITITASDQLVDPGTGGHTIQFASGASGDTLVLHLGGSDQVLGFTPSAGDMLDFSSLLTEAGLNIGGDIAQLANYISVANDAGAAAIMFDPTGQGGGSQVALLVNDGGLVAQLQTLKAFHA